MLIWCTHMFHFIWHNIHPHIIVCNRSRLTFSINIDLLTWHHFKSTINLLDSCGLGWTCFCRSAATWFYSLIGLHLTQPGLPLSGCSHLTLQSDWTRLDSTQLASVGVQPPDSTVWLDLTWLNPACLCQSAATRLYSLIGLDLTQPSLTLSECSHLTLQSDWTRLDSTQLASVRVQPPDCTVWLDLTWLNPACLCQSAATWLYSLIGLDLTQPSLPLLECSHLTLQSNWTWLDSTQLASVRVQPPDSTVWLDLTWLNPACLCQSAATWVYSLIGLDLTQPSLPLLECSHLTLQSDWTWLDSTQLASFGVQPPDSTVWLDLTWLNPACLFQSAATWLYSLIGLNLTQPSLTLLVGAHP